MPYNVKPDATFKGTLVAPDGGDEEFAIAVKYEITDTKGEGLAATDDFPGIVGQEKQVKVFLHLAGTAMTEPDARALLDKANEIWHGACVRFVVEGVDVIADPGVVSIKKGEGDVFFEDLATRHNRPKMVNLYLVGKFHSNWRNILALEKPIDDVRTVFLPDAVKDGKVPLAEFGSIERILAHELGHTIGLLNYYGSSNDLMYAKSGEEDGQMITGTKITLEQAKIARKNTP